MEHHIVKSSIPFVAFGESGPALHFAHANAYPAECYRQLLDELGNNECQIIASAHRPLWDTNVDSFNSWHQLADDQISFIEAHFDTPVIGMGHSLGGVVTLVAAATRPDLYSSIILLDPVLLTGFRAQLLKLIPTRWRSIVHPYIGGAKKRRHHWPSREQAITHFRSKSVFSRFSDQAIADLVDGGLIPSEDGLTLKFTKEWEVRIYETIIENPWKYLKQLKLPVYGLRGSHSDSLFEDAVSRWRKHPHSTVEEIPYGHLFPLEAPKETANRVVAFINHNT